MIKKIGILTIFLLFTLNSTYTENNVTPRLNKTINITISGFAFSPSLIQVSPGEDITFVVQNNDGFSHTFTADNGDFDITISGGQSGTVDWTAPMTASTITWHCRFHPSMVGTIEVASTNSSSPSNSTTSGSNSTSSSTATNSTPSSPTTVNPTQASDITTTSSQISNNQPSVPGFTLVVSMLSLLIIIKKNRS